MKVAFIVRHYNKTGGISGCVAELAERLSISNEVHIFTASWQDADNSRIIFHKIPIVSLRFLKNLKKFAWNNIFEVWSFVFFSLFMVKPENFDIVHSMGDYIGRFDVFTVHSCHKAWLELARSGKVSVIEWLKKSFLNPLHFNVLLVEKHSLKTAKKIICISKRIEGEILKYYNVLESKIEIIPNGVDTVKFNPENKAKYSREIRQLYNLKETDIVIIFPAHEFKRKGLFQIVEALNILQRKDIHVLVVGRDDKTHFLEIIQRHGIEKNMIFVGETKGIEKYYAASDLLVFPTAYEPFGLVITEAMASGVPIIVSKEAGAAELIKNGENGSLLQDYKNPAELADKIAGLIKDKPKLALMAQRAREAVVQYSWDRISEKTMSLYRSILGNR